MLTYELLVIWFNFPITLLFILSSYHAMMSLATIWLIAWFGTGISILMLVSVWKIFSKTGRHGYEVLVPIHNIYERITLAWRPWRWIFLVVAPYIIWMLGMTLFALTLNTYMMIIWIALGILLWVAYFVDLNIQTGKRFGKSGGFIFWMIILPIIFYPILGIGNSTYTPRSIPAEK